MSSPIHLIDVARAIEAVVGRQPNLAGLDRSGRASTAGRGKMVRGVGVERKPDGDLFARVEVVGMLGTILTEAGDTLTEAIERELDGLGLTATVLVVITDLADEKPEAATA
jgi:hypothetical protein